MTMMGEGTGRRADTPEALFLAWLFAQPSGTDIPSAARLEIARVDRIEIAADQRARLIGLLTQATVTPQGASRKARRQRH
ncbi:MAG TPA: hypothetical protein VN112_25110 [Ensifer sp.]|nr:hypothetical protein [Ensifer sp.]